MCRESSVGNEPAALRSNRHQCGYFFFLFPFHRLIVIMISFQGEGLSSSSSFMLLTKWWVPQCTECDPGTVAAKFVMDEKKPSAGSQNVCLSVCETSVIFSLFLSTYIYMPPYVQHSICNREKGSTFSERERHKQQAGGEEGKWITFEEPQNGPLLTYSNVSNRERKKWKEKKKISVRHELATISSREGDGRTVRLKGGRSAPLAGLNPHPARALFFPIPVRAKWWNSNFVFFHQWPGR